MLAMTRLIVERILMTHSDDSEALFSLAANVTEKITGKTSDLGIELDMNLYNINNLLLSWFSDKQPNMVTI